MKRIPTDIPTATEIMQRRIHTISVEDDLDQAIRSLLKSHHSGAPVVDAAGKLLGVLSEHDCISVLAQAVSESWPTGRVGDRMTTDVETVSPDDDVLALSTRFNQGRHRRLLVVDQGKLVGLISRRDLLKALESLVAQLDRGSRETTYDAIGRRHQTLD